MSEEFGRVLRRWELIEGSKVDDRRNRKNDRKRTKVLGHCYLDRTVKRYNPSDEVWLSDVDKLFSADIAALLKNDLYTKRETDAKMAELEGDPGPGMISLALLRAMGEQIRNMDFGKDD